MAKKLSDIICAKDDVQAKQALKTLIETKDLGEFEHLCEKMDFVFDFIRNNVYKRFSSVLNKDNFKTVLNFFDVYSPYFDDFFTSILAKYADEDLTDEIFDMLENGSDSQKTYSALYFSKIPDTISKEALLKNLSTDFDPLFENCAKALGKMRDEESYNLYLEQLKSEDDFKKLQAVRFIVSYGEKKDLKELINSMQNSNMGENIAGEITNLVAPSELFDINFGQGALLFNRIIDGLGEILPLDNFLYYEIPYVCDYLLKNTDNNLSLVLLLNLKKKLNDLTQNEEYIFDLDKDTKNEIFNVKKVLNSKNIEQDLYKLKGFIKEDNPFLYTVLDIVRENNFNGFVDEIIELTKSKNETLICEAVYTLKKSGEIKRLDKTQIKINNPNLKAILDRHFED